MPPSLITSFWKFQVTYSDIGVFMNRDGYYVCYYTYPCVHVYIYIDTYYTYNSMFRDSHSFFKTTSATTICLDHQVQIRRLLPSPLEILVLLIEFLSFLFFSWCLHSWTTGRGEEGRGTGESGWDKCFQFFLFFFFFSCTGRGRKVGERRKGTTPSSQTTG